MGWGKLNKQKLWCNCNSNRQNIGRRDKKYVADIYRYSPGYSQEAQSSLPAKLSNNWKITKWLANGSLPAMPYWHYFPNNRLTNPDTISWIKFISKPIWFRLALTSLTCIKKHLMLSTDKESLPVPRCIKSMTEIFKQVASYNYFLTLTVTL